MKPPTAIAIAAHPDDIEFQMAGTLLLLKNAGWEIHYFNLATGNGGSTVHGPDETAAIRREESIEAASILGAHWHPPIANDLEIFYNDLLLRKVAAVVREVRPSIVLTHPLQDYMEDHMITARLAVTAAFAHGISNYRTDPPRDAYSGDVALYHCTPHGGRDPLRKKVTPGAWTNTSGVHQTALAALAAHRSQKEWLEATQGMSSYLDSMEEKARAMGDQSGRFEFAEGWWRHLHTGFASTDTDQLAAVLGDNYHINPVFEASLEL